MAIDVITGKVFQPRFQGQRTAVDLEAIMDEEGVSAQEAVEIALTERYAGNVFYNTTHASLQDEYNRMHEEALRSNPNAERHIVSAEEAAQAAGRTGRAAEDLMVSLQGGGANPFLRTESGLGNWRAMDAEGKFGTQRILNGIDYNVVPEDLAWVALQESSQETALKGGHDSGFAVGETGAADDTVRRNMEDAFVSALQLAGLESDLIKKLWTWAEDKLVSDPSFTATRALLEMYDHEAFQARFPAIKAMHDAGVTRRDIPTPGQYIAYENEIVREMSRVGIDMERLKPDGTREVDVDTIVKDLLVGRVGIDEAISRLNEAKRMMYDVPAAVKEIFLAWAPTDSEGKTTYPESSLMLAFLDPDDKWSDIQEQIAAAETAGGAKLRAGLDISREMAERVANVSNDQAAIWNQFANLKQKEALFAETLTENIDLDMATHGVVGEFQLEGIGEGEDYMTGLELSDLITRRGQRRSAAFSGGGGAMLAGTTTGFGAANA
mgnify:CR=1 FL=1